MRILRGLLAFLLLASITVGADGASRIKDIVSIEGVRDNQLIGYGLVFGLNGTGDSRNIVFTSQSFSSMLQQLGVSVDPALLRSGNVAAVIVTATLPPFAMQGTRIDVTVSSAGDATSLLGGTLAVTPLMGADGNVYAVAQGGVVVGGSSAGGAAASVTTNVPTSGRVPSGGLIEREVGFRLESLSEVRLSLRNPDFTTARRITLAINQLLGAPAARMVDPATVILSRPPGYPGSIVDLVTDIEQLVVEPDMPARVVINELTGVVVISRDVRVSPVAIAHANLTITVTERPTVVQPLPFSSGVTAVEPNTSVSVDTGGAVQLGVVQGGVSLQQLVDGLNALGVGPRDLMSILQAIKAAGALQAELISMP